MGATKQLEVRLGVGSACWVEALRTAMRGPGQGESVSQGTECSWQWEFSQRDSMVGSVSHGRKAGFNVKQ